MKKQLLMIAVAILSASFFTSCNKGLKDDMKELEQKLAEEQAKNAKYRQNLGGDACMAVTFNTNDGTTPVTYSANHCLYYDNLSNANYVTDYGDSTYYVYVERGGDYWEEYTSIGFNYNSKTGVVELNEVYLRGFFSGMPYTSGVYFYDETGNTSNTLTVNSFNRATGAISFTFNGSTTADFSDNYYTNQPMTSKITFSGDLLLIDSSILTVQ